MARCAPSFPPAGDLGMLPHGVPGSRMGGMLMLTGRHKDTLVMSNGKNISPQPLEDLVGVPHGARAARHMLLHMHTQGVDPLRARQAAAPPMLHCNVPRSQLCSSPVVRHALVLGSDKRELGALIFPDADALEARLAQEAGGGTPAGGGAAATPSTSGAPGPAPRHPLTAAATPAQLEALLMRDFDALAWWVRHGCARRANCCCCCTLALSHCCCGPWRQRCPRDCTRRPASQPKVAHVVVVVGASLSPDDGTLTRTMKPRRQQIVQAYAVPAAALLARLRG